MSARTALAAAADLLAATDAMAELIGFLTLTTETVSGHRARLLKAGFSPSAAEDMAVQLHATLMASIQQGGQS